MLYIMVSYVCKKCDFYTTLKTNYTVHLETKKHLTLIEEKPINACKYCEKTFVHSQSMYRHIKNNCKKNKDNDLKELVRLMNLKTEQTDKQLEIQKKQIESQNKQIEKLMGKLEINSSFNTTINNITLLSYKDTDVSHLTDVDYIGCIKKVNFCIKGMIEKIHFNPEKPENMNIYIPNLKNKYLMMYDGKNWNITNKRELQNVCDDKETLIEDWINKEQHKYPELKEKFMRYINNKDDDDTLNMIKDDIKLMLYNNKIMIES